MDWSPQQVEALERIEDWLADGGDDPFRLFGYAGTGKTTLLNELAKRYRTRTAAYTGKAALVLRRKGIARASTIHSLIYRAVDKPALQAELDELKKKEILTPAELQRMQELKEELRGPAFVLREELRGENIYSIPMEQDRPELIMLDECSMIDEEMAEDLLSFEIPLLVVGDPAQLPPIYGEGYFTNNAEPDMMLTEIHRQARGSPIITMATLAREGKKLHGRFGNCGVATSLPANWWRDWQLLCGRNTTRRNYNARARAMLGFDEGELPMVGDRLVCLRNNHELGLLNGSLWTVRDVSYGHRNAPYFSLKVVSLDDGIEVECHAHTRIFLEPKPDWLWKERLKAQEFDYGYALTVHKAQGSQWDKVVLVDESWCFRKHSSNWLYTGVTRAAEQLTVIR